MKWLALVCLFICSTISESRHLQKRDVDHHSRTIADIFKQVGEQSFNHVVLAMVAQNLQKCSLEEHEKFRKEITDFAKHCEAHEEDAECKKPMTTLFHDKICKIPDIGNSYPWITECCTKEEAERLTCFKEHKDIKEPYKKPDVEEICKEHKEHPEHAFDHYIDKIGKKHPTLYPPVVVGIAAQYNTVVGECCAAEDKQKCFEDRALELAKKTYYVESLQKQACRTLEDFPERVFSALKLCAVSAKYPGATFEDIYKLVLELVHLNKDCCKGDVIECMVERLEFTQHTCDHHEKLSSNLKGCCEKPLLERAPCILALPNEEAPADLPKDLPKFVDDEHVCKHYEEDKNKFLAEFTYEFSRRHGELSPQSLLRTAKGYEELLIKCCATEHPHECYKTAPQLLEAGIKELHRLEKENCEAFQTKGPYYYELEILNLYTRKLPQVSYETLLEISGKLTKIAAKCCALPENQKIRCGEEKLDLLLGETCERQKTVFVNDNVRHCCADSYALRRPCFTGLGPDPTYKHVEPEESAFHLTADICEAKEDEQQLTKKKLLIQLLKLDNTLPQEKLDELVKEFLAVIKKCCEDASHQACFDLEKPALFLHIKAAVTH